MNIVEALEFTLEKVDELKKEGIKLEIRPYKGKSEQKDRPLPKEKWCRVKFYPKNKIESKKIHEMGNYLAMAGVGFDSGGSAGVRDWELDWSFRYTKQENYDLVVARNELQEMFNEMEE